ncbi:MAG: PQQ-binding-like beta-propeller repeat protein [Bdellovibrionales bacterium]
MIRLFLIFLCPLSFSFTEKNFSKEVSKKEHLNLHHVWSVNLDPSRKIRRSLAHNSSPLLTKNLVIQANGINGVQAFSKDKAELIWSFAIPNGVFSSLTLNKNHIYFGASDGFFYSLEARTGKLVWKFFTGSENLGPALIHRNKVYWTSLNQKVYALSLKGDLLWTYAGPFLTRKMVVRSRPRPFIYKGRIYMGFYDGSLVALNQNNGSLKWKKQLSSKAIVGNLFIKKSCLFVSTFKTSLSCLNPLNGKRKWKLKGESFLFPKGRFLYKISQKNISAVKKTTLKTRWSIPLKAAPALASIYKNYLIYGSLSDGSIHIVDKERGQTLSNFKFGKGLASSVTIDNNGDIYFLSVDARIHKIRIN